MINQSYRLVSPKTINITLIEEQLKANQIIVRPTYLSICAADQRYYQGTRGKEILEKKLPMALIHEAIGEVLYDPEHKYQKGDKVVLIPNWPSSNDDITKENYLPSSKFCASGIDGFMQSLVLIDHDRVLPYHHIDSEAAVLLELLSVGMNALEYFERISHHRKNTIGIWGGGSVGFVVALIMKKTFPNTKIYVFDNNPEKLSYFSFVDNTYLISEIPDILKIDHAFECVGGLGSEKAIAQIIDLINPQGTLSLLGVSESDILINTRKILEKGLYIIGNSRSGKEDFEAAIAFLEKHPETQQYLKTIISEIITIKEVKDIHTAFNNDLNNNFKTIMKWEI